MKSLRSTFPAIALLVAVMATTAAPAVAGLVHPFCAANQHGCGDTATISTCCCGGQAETNPSSPAESRTQLSPAPASAPISIAVAAFRDVFQTVARVHISPPRTGSVDFPTLFASLLI